MFDLDLDILITMIGLSVAGLAAVVGNWVERDHSKPSQYAWALSGLIVLATIVGMYQTYSDAEAGAKLEADMARMLLTIEKIASGSESENPELAEFMKTELAAQSRANPKVVEKLAQRVADEGGDPAEVLTKHMSASDVEGLSRSGNLKTKPPTTARIQAKTASSGGRKSMLRIKPKADAEEPVVAAPAPDTSAQAEEPRPDLVHSGEGLAGVKALAGGDKEGGRLGLGMGPKPGAKADDTARPAAGIAPGKPAPAPDAVKPAAPKPALGPKKP